MERPKSPARLQVRPRAPPPCRRSQRHTEAARGGAHLRLVLERRRRTWRRRYPVSRRLLTAVGLIDLDGSDPGLEVGVYADHASTSRSVAPEADDLDDV